MEKQEEINKAILDCFKSLVSVTGFEPSKIDTLEDIINPKKCAQCGITEGTMYSDYHSQCIDCEKAKIYKKLCAVCDEDSAKRFGI